MDPKTLPTVIKDYAQVIHTLLTLVLFVALMFGGDSTKITESMDKASKAAALAEQLQKQLLQVQGNVEQIKTTVRNPVLMGAAPGTCPCPDCPPKK